MGLQGSDREIMPGLYDEVLRDFYEVFDIEHAMAIAVVLSNIEGSIVTHMAVLAPPDKTHVIHRKSVGAPVTLQSLPEFYDTYSSRNIRFKLLIPKRVADVS